MPLAPVNYETWHCVPSNNWAIGISATTYASAWGSLSAQQRKNFVHSLAYAAYLASQELIALGKSPIPAKFISRDEAMAGVWGFTYHREMDPGRRTDPANPKDAFPWDEFLTEYKRLMGEKTATTDKSEEDVMNHFVFEAKDAKGRKHQYIFNPRSWTHQYIKGDVDKNNYRTIVENVGDKFHVHWGELRGKAGSDELGAVHLLGTYVGPADFRPVGV